MKFEIYFLLPLAGFVAIVLFVLREGLEYFRKKKGRERKICAAKSLLAFEAERNYYSQKAIFSIVQDIKDHHELKTNSEYCANISSAGDVRYCRRDDGDTHVAFGMPIPMLHTSEIDRWLPTVAEIDKKLFEEVMSMYLTMFELKHLRSSLLRYLLNEEDEGQFWLEGFAEYALEHTSEIERSFRSYYKVCKGTSKIPTRMR